MANRQLVSISEELVFLPVLFHGVYSEPERSGGDPTDGPVSSASSAGGFGFKNHKSSRFATGGSGLRANRRVVKSPGDVRIRRNGRPLVLIHRRGFPSVQPRPPEAQPRNSRVASAGWDSLARIHHRSPRGESGSASASSFNSSHARSPGL